MGNKLSTNNHNIPCKVMVKLKFLFKFQSLVSTVSLSSPSSLWRVGSCKKKMKNFSWWLVALWGTWKALKTRIGSMAAKMKARTTERYCRKLFRVAKRPENIWLIYARLLSVSPLDDFGNQNTLHTGMEFLTDTLQYMGTEAWTLLLSDVFNNSRIYLQFLKDLCIKTYSTRNKLSQLWTITTILWELLKLLETARPNKLITEMINGGKNSWK